MLNAAFGETKKTRLGDKVLSENSDLIVKLPAPAYRQAGKAGLAGHVPVKIPLFSAQNT